MKLFKIIISIISCAVFSFVYVHQEVEIVKTGFLIDKHRHKLSLLLDQHRSLVYNLSRLESPRRIEDTLSVNEIVLSMPKIGNIHRRDRIDLAYTEEMAKTGTEKSFLANMFDRFSTKAEAKVVK